jgi:hypothetical protein
LQPDPIELVFDSTNVACYGDSTGMVKVTASAGEGGYTYLWDDGNASTTAQVNDLPAGTYTVTVTDVNTCEMIGSVIVGQPSASLSVTVATTETDCGAGSGTINLTPVGGTPYTASQNYTYTWAHNGLLTGPLAEDLAVGAYNVIIEDSLGCSIDTTINIQDNSDLVVDGFTVITPVSCNSACDGEIEVAISGGSGDFAFAWDNSVQTTAAITDVCGGQSYTVTISDNVTSCSIVSEAFEVPHPDVLVVSVVDSTAALCHADSSGTATITIIGGTEPYNEFAWYTATNDTVSTIQNATTLPFGWNYINVTDANGCEALDSVYIQQPLTALSVTKDSTPTGCGTATGSATVTPAGGTPFTVGEQYHYLWEDGQNTATAINLASGIYSCTITDSNNCELIVSVGVIDDSELEVTVDLTTNVSCNGECDGTAEISISNNDDYAGGYEFLWSNGEITQNAEKLCAGTNTVLVTDEKGCSREVEVEITQPLVLSATKDQNDPSCYGESDGTAEVVVSGGTPDYEYLWSNGQTTAQATGLAEGEYMVTITDAHNCERIENFTLTAPDRISFDFDITQTSCGDSLGTIEVINIAGGAGNYSVVWSHDDWVGAPDSTNTLLQNLWVDTYSIRVSDELSEILYSMSFESKVIRCNSPCWFSSRKVILARVSFPVEPAKVSSMRSAHPPSAGSSPSITFHALEASYLPVIGSAEPAVLHKLNVPAVPALLRLNTKLSISVAQISQGQQPSVNSS